MLINNDPVGGFKDICFQNILFLLRVNLELSMVNCNMQEP